MNRVIFPTFLIGLSLAVFIYYIDPQYKELKQLEVEKNQYSDALSKSSELKSVRDSLLSKYNTFSQEDLEKLNKLLPDTVDNVKLIMDIDSIASKYGMNIKDTNVNINSSQQEEVLGPEEKKYGIVEIGFSAETSYENFIRFIRDLEISGRIIDITYISFKTTEVTNVYKYTVRFKTYWLK